MTARMVVGTLALVVLGPSGCGDGPVAPGDLASPGPDLSFRDAPPGQTGDLTPFPGGVKLRLNEIFPNGTDNATDPDWIEITNIGDTMVSPDGFQVSDGNPAHLAPVPTYPIFPGAFQVINCGSGSFQPNVPFTLDGPGGGSVVLVDAQGHIVDSATWPPNTVLGKTSWARLPDGTGDFKLSHQPTQGANMP